jgi:hypothetical protein
VSHDRLVLTLCALALAACADLAHAGRGDVREIDCDRLDARAAREILSQAPAPRIILIQGSLPWITMEPVARFLAAMGYPADRLRDPRDGATSRSAYGDSERLAGEVAWYYEHDGMAPMLIGHSRGGMLVIRTLHELAGAFHHAIPVVDPWSGEAQARTDIVDPYTHRRRPVIGLRVDYAAAIATGRLPRLLEGQWRMLTRLRDIPDTVREFTGYRIEGDLIAGNLTHGDPYVAHRLAQVRNVVLPASYGHIGAIRLARLAQDPLTRAWIDAWQPAPAAAPPRAAALPQPEPGAAQVADTRNILLAADLWYGVRRAWCRAAQARAGAKDAQ